MTIPIFILPVEPGFEKNVSLAEVSTQLGDNYEQTMKLGLNPENVTYKIKSIALTESQYQSVESQLRTFRGITSFLWSPDPDNIPREGFYCDKWEWTREGVNAWILNAEFKRDFQAPCDAFSEFLNPSLFLTQLEEAVWWLDRYTRNTKPLVINSDGVSVNAFHDVVGRGGYFPPSSGTSEGQATIIRSLLLARKCPISTAAKAKCLELALLLAEALITYFYLEPIPTNPTAQIWLPHWLVNAKENFVAKGAIAPKFINNGHFDVVVSFTSGVGFIPTGAPNWGDKVAEVQRVYSTDGQLLWRNIYSGLVKGTNYPIDYWVSDQQLLGNRFRFYPSTLSNAGQNPTPTTEAAGKIVLKNTSFTGNAIVVYTSYTGVTIAKNAGFEAFPAWRALDPGEKNHATDASQWLHDCYVLLHEATGDEKWNRARQANQYSTIATSTVLNDSYLFKKDTTTTEPFSYPGTQLIVYNNENAASCTATRLSDGWVEATIVDGNTPFPGAELQNFAVALQMQTNVTLDYEVSASQNTILEIYLSTSKDAFNFQQNYTYWLPVVANTVYTGALKPDEFLKYNVGTVWHPTIADNPVYTYSGGPSTNTATVTREIVTINTFRRLVATINLTQSVGGFAGAGLVFFNPGNRPPRIFYSKTGSRTLLKIKDGANKEFFWELPDTAGGYQEFAPTWDNADVIPGTPSDQPIESIEFVLPSNTSGSSTVSLWYAGDEPERLPYPCVCFKTSVTSRIDTAHTFKVGDIRGNGSPLANLFGNPGVLPFTVNMINGVVDAWRGAPNTGYQSPRIYAPQVWNYPDRAQQVLDFFLSSQNAYAGQNVNNTDGFFVTSYVWPIWSAGVGQQFNQWSFTESVDPSFDWEGYQFRPIVETANYWRLNPSDRKAKAVTMRFLGGLDRLQRKNNESRCPTNFPAQLDPQFNYVSPHASALAIRAALFANLAGGDPAITFRIIKRNLDFLLSEYIATGTMRGSFTASQSTFVGSDSLTYRENFGFWVGEIIETLAYLYLYGDQITYPACSTPLV